MVKPLYFYNGSSFELVGPTTPQSPIAYQTSAPTAPATGDIWIDSDGDVDTYNRQLTRYYFVATTAQTTITGTDANGLTLAYVAGSEAVYVNGALQVRGQDYTATNGTSVVLSSALAVNDVVEIFAYTAFTVANAYTKSETDGVAAAAAGLRMVVPTSVAVGSGTGSVDANGAVTFSGASSVSLNSCFISTYQNYRIVVSNLQGSNSTALNLRLRASGTDTSTGYYGSNIYMVFTSTAVNGGATNNGSNIGISSVVNTADTPSFLTFEVGHPRDLKQVHVIANSFQADSYISLGAWKQQNSGAVTYDGFTLYPGAGTISGTVRVYGYKN